jgi:KDO2-lipid IV(A) lauroyltransferase
MSAWLSADHPSHPRYWPVWFGFGLLRGLTWLPTRLLPAVGRPLGWILYIVLPRRRRIAAVNLAVCFPETSRQWQRRTLRRHFEALGIGLLEFGMGWWKPDRALRPAIAIEGEEHLREALQRGKGVILLNGHFTTLELAGRALGLIQPLDVVYRRNENPVVERFLRHHRNHRAEAAIPRDNLRGMIRSLRANHALAYFPDQGLKGRHSLLVPFFSIPAWTTTATARLARASGAAVVPMFLVRGRGRRPYTLYIEPALEDFPSGDPEADTVRVNQILESAIRRAPEQYLWIHRRFKKRPGLPDLYGSVDTPAAAARRATRRRRRRAKQADPPSKPP